MLDRPAYGGPAQDVDSEERRLLNQLQSGSRKGRDSASRMLEAIQNRRSREESSTAAREQRQQSFDLASQSRADALSEAEKGRNERSGALRQLQTQQETDRKAQGLVGAIAQTVPGSPEHKALLHQYLVSQGIDLSTGATPDPKDAALRRFAGASPNATAPTTQSPPTPTGTQSFSPGSLAPQQETVFSGRGGTNQVRTAPGMDSLNPPGPGTYYNPERYRGGGWSGLRITPEIRQEAQTNLTKAWQNDQELNRVMNPAAAGAADAERIAAQYGAPQRIPNNAPVGYVDKTGAYMSPLYDEKTGNKFPAPAGSIGLRGTADSAFPNTVQGQREINARPGTAPIPTNEAMVPNVSPTNTPTGFAPSSLQKPATPTTVPAVAGAAPPTPLAPPTSNWNVHQGFTPQGQEANQSIHNFLSTFLNLPKLPQQQQPQQPQPQQKKPENLAIL